MNLAVSIQTTCDIMINPQLYAGDEEMSQLIAEEWNWDGSNITRSQSILSYAEIRSLVVMINVLYPLRGKSQ